MCLLAILNSLYVLVLVKAAPASVSAKVKNRLEEIEDFEEVSNLNY